MSRTAGSKLWPYEIRVLLGTAAHINLSRSACVKRDTGAARDTYVQLTV
jgi:hypothetical protein